MTDFGLILITIDLQLYFPWAVMLVVVVVYSPIRSFSHTTDRGGGALVTLLHSNHILQLLIGTTQLQLEVDWNRIGINIIEEQRGIMPGQHRRYFICCC